jgi:hypothetical protein
VAVAGGFGLLDVLEVKRLGMPDDRQRMKMPARLMRVRRGVGDAVDRSVCGVGLYAMHGSVTGAMCDAVSCSVRGVVWRAVSCPVCTGVRWRMRCGMYDAMYGSMAMRGAAWREMGEGCSYVSGGCRAQG